MASGPQHYMEAERLLNASRDESELAAAQVHATLALAAATALSAGGDGLPVADYYAWRNVAEARDGEDDED